MLKQKINNRFTQNGGSDVEIIFYFGSPVFYKKMKMKKKLFAKGFVKEIKENGGITGAVASTGSIDREGDILDPGGWKLDNFRAAPRLLWSHMAHELPIGKITNIIIDALGNLVFDAEFAEKENDFAKKVADLMRGGFLNTFSVGFMPLKQDGQKFLENELLEISVVNVPANPEARLSLAYKSFEEDVEKIIAADKKIDENAIDEEINTDIKTIEKDGRVLSEKNRALIKVCIDAMDQSISALKDLLISTEPAPKKEAVEPQKKVETRKADRRMKMLRALRLVDKAVEFAILETKKGK